MGDHGGDVQSTELLDCFLVFHLFTFTTENVLLQCSFAFSTFVVVVAWSCCVCTHCFSQISMLLFVDIDGCNLKNIGDQSSVIHKIT